MTVSPGRLASALADRYRIERQLGQGGMATVYLAEDLKHDRQVAIKVLRPELAAVLGAERFVVEIKTTAALQHPHILPLFDSGSADGFLFYVMPYIEGETLRSRLDREKQLGIEEAVRITREVADALDYAHRHGVIHRDIKPENILLHDGRPMVADFGIALALSAAAGGRMTETGLSLGTPHYMSPEQATADRDITARSDVYSLASVLYEMLTGDPPHTGSSAQQIIMKIVTDTARPVTELRRAVPPHVAAAVAQALEKLPADRFDSARAFAEALGNPGFRTAAMTSLGSAAGPAGRRSPLVWALGATSAILAVALGTVLATRRAAPPEVTLNAFLSDTVLRVQGEGGIGISPDGSKVIIRTGQDGFFLRNAGEEGFRHLEAPVGAMDPAVTPDGEYLMFIEPRSGGVPTLRRIPVGGGPVVTVAEAWGLAGWCDDGSMIVYGRNTILRLTEAGKPPVQLAVLDSVPLVNPSVLPDCRGVLFTDAAGGNGRLLLLDLRTGAVTQVLERGNRPLYSPTGHILYQSDRPAPALMALPFDLGQRRVTGAPFLLVPGIGNWRLSQNGTLVFAESRAGALGAERLVWVDPGGRMTPLPIQVADFETPRLSPDGRRIAYLDFNARTLYLYDVLTGTTTRVVGPMTEMTEQSWAWSADSKALYTSMERVVTRFRTDGTGRVDTVYHGEVRIFDVTPDESGLVIGLESEARGWDIAILRFDGNEPAIEPYLRANWDERQPALSPDGRWLAYVSNESGANEVYVRAFPDPGDPVRISDGAGAGPAWSADGGAIFYAGPEAMMKARVAARGPTLSVQSRTRLFPHAALEVTAQEFFQRFNLPRRWDLARTGDRFLMVNSTEEVFDIGVRLRIITNFFAEIRRRAVVP